jgi:hypothetical protein
MVNRFSIRPDDSIERFRLRWHRSSRIRAPIYRPREIGVVGLSANVFRRGRPLPSSCRRRGCVRAELRNKSNPSRPIHSRWSQDTAARLTLSGIVRGSQRCREDRFGPFRSIAEIAGADNLPVSQMQDRLRFWRESGVRVGFFAVVIDAQLSQLRQ